MTWDPGTIPQVLDRIADQYSEHDALVTPDRRLTYVELRDEVRRAAAAMVDLGVRAGDRVAVWSPNTWHWVVGCSCRSTPDTPPAKPPTSSRAPARRCCSLPGNSSAPTRQRRSTAPPFPN